MLLTFPFWEKCSSNFQFRDEQTGFLGGTVFLTDEKKQSNGTKRQVDLLW